MKRGILIGGVVTLLAALLGGCSKDQTTTVAPSNGSVIFFHVDGAGVAHWQMARMMLAGPDGDIYWDRLPHLAVYRGHLDNALTPSSNAAATVHAYGVKVPYDAFGTDGQTGQPPVAPSGLRRSIMHEAQARGIAVGVVNSGSAVEPGTAAFLTGVSSRANDAEVVAGLVASGAEVILSGGEEWFLPEGVEGRHGHGRRQDGRNLIEEAAAAGYRVIFTRQELLELPERAGKVLGVFSAKHTFNDGSDEDIASRGVPLYDPAAPTIAEMTRAALRMLSGSQFLLVVEEEGADNFGNHNNAAGSLEALLRADEGLGVAMSFVEQHPETLLVTSGDSEAGNPDVLGLRGSDKEAAMLQTARDANGAPLDGATMGADGSIIEPFLAAPDQAGRRQKFLVSWGTRLDSAGGMLVRATGFNADKVRGSFDNTAFYPLVYETLFGEKP